MNFKKITKIFIIAALVIILGYDLIALLQHQDATISEALWKWVD